MSSTKQLLDQLFEVTDPLSAAELEGMDPVRRRALEEMATTMVAYGYTDEREIDGLPRGMAAALLRELEADLDRHTAAQFVRARPPSRAELHQRDLLAVGNRAIRRST